MAREISFRNRRMKRGEDFITNVYRRPTVCCSDRVREVKNAIGGTDSCTVHLLFRIKTYYIILFTSLFRVSRENNAKTSKPETRRTRYFSALPGANTLVPDSHPDRFLCVFVFFFFQPIRTRSRKMTVFPCLLCERRQNFPPYRSEYSRG